MRGKSRARQGRPRCRWNSPALVVVLVAEVALEGAEELSYREIGALGTTDAAYVDHGVEGKGRAAVVGGAATDGGATRKASNLPLAEGVVDVRVVHEEGRVTRGVDLVLHRATDTVVTLSMVTIFVAGLVTHILRYPRVKRTLLNLRELNATVEFRVVRAALAQVVRVDASIGGGTLIHGTLDAVRVVGCLARSQRGL